MTESVQVKSNPKLRVTSLNGNYKKATATFNPNIDFLMNEKDVGIWYIRIRNIQGRYGEFIGGEYIAEMRATDNFPFDPPQFYFYTPNGVYGTRVKVCIGIGEYHKGDYPAAKGMGGFAQELVNGIMCWEDLGSGINILHTSVSEKTGLAAASVAWNKKNHPELVARFNSIPRYLLHQVVETLPYNYPEPDVDKIPSPQELYDACAQVKTKRDRVKHMYPTSRVNRIVYGYLRGFVGL